ncbi:uroporphyrinogen-III synthase [Paenirhodobacter sp.]|uniref:uroporphyrinogen-III synthase n=1 Tax=Paenirhodobacter sp. TaxID=1965326 RepID=UPI003B41A118
MTTRPTVLVTRPAEAAARFADAFRARFGADWPVVSAPLTEIVPTGTEVPQADVLIFTSERGVTVPGAGRLAYCVGTRTAQAARAAGFRVVTGPGEARGLCALILSERPRGRIVHARGLEVARPIAAELTRAGLPTAEVIVYRQQDLPLSPQARGLLDRPGPILVPLFSPRGAARFAAAARGARAMLWIAAISGAAARACTGAETGAERLEIAPSPDQGGILDAIAQLLKNQAG